MKKKFKIWTTPFVLGLVTAVGLSSCHKTPIRNNPVPVSSGVWKKVSSLPNDQIQVLEVADNTLYAASASGIIYSMTDGANWTTSNAAQPVGAITALTVFKNKLYAGTQTKGIFSSTDAGKTWTNTAGYFPEVSSFAKLNDTLYSSSGEYSGIVMFDESRNSWPSFTRDGLPTNYNLDVQKIIPVNNTLVSVQGENGNYYVFDKNTRHWSEHYFFGTYKPGLRVYDMIYDAGVLYAAYDGAILISRNAGVNWSYDTVGLKRGFAVSSSRMIYAGSDYYYTLHDTPGNETWIQKRRRGLPGSSWAVGEELLPFGHSYSIREFNSMLFLATDQGVYFKNLAE